MPIRKKKSWLVPKLMILVRKSDNESILGVCKFRYDDGPVARSFICGSCEGQVDCEGSCETSDVS